MEKCSLILLSKCKTNDKDYILLQQQHKTKERDKNRVGKRLMAVQKVPWFLMEPGIIPLTRQELAYPVPYFYPGTRNDPNS